MLAGLVRVGTVVGEGQEGASQRVQVGDRGRVGVSGGFLGGVALGAAQLIADALGVPSLPAGRLRLEVLVHVSLDVFVGARVAGLYTAGGDGVVRVVGRLLPRVGDDLVVGVVRVQSGDDAPDRVVEQHRADADSNTELEAVALFGKLAEEGLVLADGFALVVEDGPAAAHPAWANDRPTFDERPWLGLDLSLDLAAEPVGVGEADLDIGGLRWLRIADVRLTRQGGGIRRYPFGWIVRMRLLRALKAVQVIDDARRRPPQPIRRGHVWVLGIVELVHL